MTSGHDNLLKIAVLVLNYNGLVHLKRFIPALSFVEEDPSVDLFIIDNASYDGSCDYVNENFSWVKTIRNTENYGFGEGYNVGIETLKRGFGEYSHYLLVNNDTIPTKQWLDNMKESAVTASDDVAEIGCRSLFVKKIIRESIISSSDISKLKSYILTKKPHAYVSVDKSRGKNALWFRAIANSNVLPQNITRLMEQGIDKCNRWYLAEIYNTDQNSSVDISINVLYDFILETVSPKLTIMIVKKNLEGNGGGAYTLVKNTKLLLVRVVSEDENIPRLIQNSGNGINSRFEGFDLHCYDASDTRQDHKAVKGICGVCKLIKRSCFERVGGFDANFFMYYEDLDLSLRLKKAGYRSIVNEKAELLHDHSATSDALSRFFEEQVMWSLFYFHYKHANIIRKISTWLRFSVAAWLEKGGDKHPFTWTRVNAITKFKEVVNRPYLSAYKG